jgi:hypothetical protein
MLMALAAADTTERKACRLAAYLTLTAKQLEQSVNWSCGAPAAVFGRNAARPPHPREIFGLGIESSAFVCAMSRFPKP